MKLELVSLESNCKVALSDPVSASLEGHLVAGQPAVVAHHSSTVDGGAVDVIVHIAADVNVVAFVARLELAALLARETWSGGRQDYSVCDKSWTCEGHLKGLSSRLAAAPFSVVLTQCLGRRRSQRSALVPWLADGKAGRNTKVQFHLTKCRGSLSIKCRPVVVTGRAKQGHCLTGAPMQLEALQYHKRRSHV